MSTNLGKEIIKDKITMTIGQDVIIAKIEAMKRKIVLRRRRQKVWETTKNGA